VEEVTRRELAEAAAEAAADDDPVQVEQVHDRGAGRRDRVVGVVDQLAREGVAVLERTPGQIAPHPGARTRTAADSYASSNRAPPPRAHARYENGR
jgi:hypothetical protein